MMKKKKYRRIATVDSRLRLALEKRHMNQAELARQTGTIPSAVSHYYWGSRLPGIEKVMQLADALDVNPLWLLGYDVEM